MRKFLLFAPIICLALPATAQEVKLETPQQVVSYGIGMQIAQSLMKRGLTTVDSDALALAIKDRMTGRQPRITQQELQAAQGIFQEEARQEKVALATATQAEGDAFLAGNRTREGVVVLDSGLQYLEITKGEGESPAETDTVSVHYRGTLIDGTEFDSSFKRGQPAQFQVDQVIAGWTQALQLMAVGSKWELWIPAALAYGERGAGGQIGPNTTLHFEVELLAIDK
jgi:FKBP-type peptidyl-prolyl cis-trans isomerase